MIKYELEKLFNNILTTRFPNLRFEVFMVFKMHTVAFGLYALYVFTNMLEENTASIFGVGVNMEVKAICSSEMLVSTYKATQHYNTEDHNPQIS
jgi:hypothetical protein